MPFTLPSITVDESLAELLGFDLFIESWDRDDLEFSAVDYVLESDSSGWFLEVWHKGLHIMLSPDSRAAQQARAEFRLSDDERRPKARRGGRRRSAQAPIAASRSAAGIE